MYFSYWHLVVNDLSGKSSKNFEFINHYKNNSLKIINRIILLNYLKP